VVVFDDLFVEFVLVVGIVEFVVFVGLVVFGVFEGGGKGGIVVGACGIMSA